MKELVKKKPRTESWIYRHRVKPLLMELKCRYNRIENCAGADYPDLDITWQGINFKIEMKIARGGKGLMHISDGQMAWHVREQKAGGNAFILAYWADRDELHMFKLEPEKFRIIEYETKIVEKPLDLLPSV